MDIIINHSQLDTLKDTYETKYVNNADLYKSPQKGTVINQTFNQLKLIDILELYGELMKEHSGIITKKPIIGYCEDGSPIHLYELNKDGKKKPIILVIGGVHGDEKSSIYGIYETVKILLSENKWSDFIMDNFIIQIVPCLNVYGFNNNKRNNSNDKDLNRDFLKQTQKETKALASYIETNKDRIKIILDSHNEYNGGGFISCKQDMPNFKLYEDIAFKLNLFLRGNYERTDKSGFIWISRSQNDGTLSDFINQNGFIGHTVEAPRSLVKTIKYPNPMNYEDGVEVTVDLLVNLMYLYGKISNNGAMYGSVIKHRKLFSSKKTFPSMFSNMIYNQIGNDLNRLYSGELFEGFYRTYPIENVSKYIEQIFGDCILDATTEEKGDSYLITFTIPKDVDNSEALDKAMALCGYYINRDGRKTNDFNHLPYVKISYASRYSDSEENIIKEQHFLYHLSPISFKNKILSKGIVPSSKNEVFSYPDRVYLFKGIDGYGRVIPLNRLAYYANILYSKMENIGNPKDTRFRDNRQTWVIFKIDTSKLTDSIKFYNDTEWGIDNMAVWTYENIPKSSIVDFSEIKLN